MSYENYDEDAEMDYVDGDDGYGDTPGNNMDIEQGGGGVDQESLPVDQKLKLAERANEIYRQQLKYMQDHLQSLRSLIQDKECIIENLTLRYDLGILQQDSSRAGKNLSPDEMDADELRRKAEGLAQRTILENFELRELVNELRDENFHLRNEIYELQDKINRQALHISKMTKNQEEQRSMQQQIGAQFDGVHPSQTEEAQKKREERAAKHDRKESEAAPDLFGQNQPEEDDYMDEDAYAKRDARQNHARKESEAMPDNFFATEDDHMDEEALAKREERAKHGRKESAQLPGNFFDDDKPEEDDYMDDAAQAKRAARQNHARKESEALPTGFMDGGSDSDEDEDARGRKRRGSQQLDAEQVDPSSTAEAKAKRAARSHKHKKNKSSVALPYNFFQDDDDSDDDPNSREKKRKHARRQSLMKAVGDKGHLSDEDTEKAPRQNYNERRDMNRKNRKAKVDQNALQDAETKGGKHARDPSIPMPVLGFDDPEVLLAFEKGSGLQSDLDDTKKELEKTKKELSDLKAAQKATASAAAAPVVPMEDPLQQNMAKKAAGLEEELNQALEKIAGFREAITSTAQTLDTTQQELSESKKQTRKREKELKSAADSKIQLVTLTSNELERFRRVINALLSIDKCKAITELLLAESFKLDS